MAFCKGIGHVALLSQRAERGELHCRGLVSRHQASMASAEARPPKWPKSKSEADRFVNLGHLVKESSLPPQASEPNPRLEAALDRLLQGIRQSRGG